MTDDEKSMHWGKFLLSAFAEIEKTEADLPDWAEVDEYSATIATADGARWTIKVSRPSDEGSDD